MQEINNYFDLVVRIFDMLLTKVSCQKKKISQKTNC